MNWSHFDYPSYIVWLNSDKKIMPSYTWNIIWVITLTAFWSKHCYSWGEDHHEVQELLKETMYAQYSEAQVMVHN